MARLYWQILRSDQALYQTRSDGFRLIRYVRVGIPIVAASAVLPANRRVVAARSACDGPYLSRVRVGRVVGDDVGYPDAILTDSWTAVDIRCAAAPDYDRLGVDLAPLWADYLAALYDTPQVPDQQAHVAQAARRRYARAVLRAEFDWYSGLLRP